MALLKDRVLVIKSINYSEADKILTVFGENMGKFAILAKGLRKLKSKNRGNMQTMSLSRITFYQGRNLGILRESVLEKGDDYDFKDIKNIERILLMLNKLITEGEVNKGLFQKIEILLDGEMTDERVNKFRLFFLKDLGLLADLKCCSLCNSSLEVSRFDPAIFQSCCEDCFGKLQEFEKKNWSRHAKYKYASKQMTNALDNYVKMTIANL